MNDGDMKITLVVTLPIHLEHYPEDVATVEQAVDYERASYEAGNVGPDELLDMASAVETTFEVAR